MAEVAPVVPLRARAPCAAQCTPRRMATQPQRGEARSQLGLMIVHVAVLVVCCWSSW